MADQKIPRVPHLVGKNKILNLEDVYGFIGDACGISKIDNTNPLSPDVETGNIRAMVADGLIRRATVRLDNGKVRTVYMTAENCPKVGALVNQKYVDGILIKTAHFPQHITLG